ncbi:MAG: hypothetical protein A07HR60_02317 [uncultured archaeon A07HR60]|nr:MAG: hypothetical protein A07HR60_02317 [uncultured archaeon A07HR60]
MDFHLLFSGSPPPHPFCGGNKSPPERNIRTPCCDVVQDSTCVSASLFSQGINTTVWRGVEIPRERGVVQPADTQPLRWRLDETRSRVTSRSGGYLTTRLES